MKLVTALIVSVLPVTAPDVKTGEDASVSVTANRPSLKVNNMVAKAKKTLQNILAGSKNIRFSDMIGLVEGFGFRLSRTEGSHHIFVHPEIPELVNLQKVKGHAKPYQMHQFLKLVERHSLKLREDK